MGKVFVSYSKFRSGQFDECPRKWWFRYASHEEDCAADAKLLSGLTEPEMLKGRVVEDDIKQCIFDVRSSKHFVPTEDQAQARIGAAVEEYKRLVKESRAVCARMHDGQFPGRNEVGLLGDFYGEPYLPARLRKCADGVRTCLETWYSGNIWKLIQTLPREDIMFVRNPNAPTNDYGKWFLDGLKVNSALDCWIRVNGNYHVPDWKAGVTGDHAEQLAVYALYMVKRLKKDARDVTVQAVQLGVSGDFEPVKISELEMESIETTIKSYHAKERELLIEGKDETGRDVCFADKEQFKPDTDSNKCRRCNFRRLCIEGRTRLAVSASDDAASIVLPLPLILAPMGNPVADPRSP